MEEFDLSSSNRQRPNRPASTHPPLTTAPINTATDSSHYSSRSSSKTRSSSKRQQDSSEDLASLKTSPTRAATPRSPTRPNAALKTASRSNLLADHQSPPPPPPLSLAPLKIRSSFENLGNGHSKSESAPVTAAAASTLSHSHFGHQLLPADYNSSATTESAFAHTRRSSIRPVLKKQKSNLSLKRTTASKLQSLSSTEQVLSSDSEFWQQLLSSTRIIQPTNM